MLTDCDSYEHFHHARRLAGDFPSARLEVISGASTYVMLDRPDQLAAAIGGFATSLDRT